MSIAVRIVGLCFWVLSSISLDLTKIKLARKISNRQADFHGEVTGV